MKSGVAGMSVASYDIDKLEATPLDHMIDDILGLLSNRLESSELSVIKIVYYTFYHV